MLLRPTVRFRAIGVTLALRCSVTDRQMNTTLSMASQHNTEVFRSALTQSRVYVPERRKAWYKEQYNRTTAHGSSITGTAPWALSALRAGLTPATASGELESLGEAGQRELRAVLL